MEKNLSLLLKNETNKILPIRSNSLFGLYLGL